MCNMVPLPSDVTHLCLTIILQIQTDIVSSNLCLFNTDFMLEKLIL